MSEFKEEHEVSLLMGRRLGYVGCGEGGILTEAGGRRPIRLILLDKMSIRRIRAYRSKATSPTTTHTLLG